MFLVFTLRTSISLRQNMATKIEKFELGRGSDFHEENSFTCQPCSFEGKCLPADRFCVDCQEHLCKKCSAYHKALKAMRNHVLVTTEEAKTVPPVVVKDKCSLKCTVHRDKGVKYFCVSHSQLGCSVCITMEHKRCSDVEYIPAVAEDIRNTSDYKMFDGNLKALKTVYESGLSGVEKNLDNIKADERQLKEAIEIFRKQMNDALDELDGQLTLEAKKIRLEETQMQHFLSNRLTVTLAEVNGLINQVDNLLANGKYCDTYVLMKKKASHLVFLQGRLVNLTEGKTYQRYELQPNTETLMVGALGNLTCRTEPVSRFSVSNGPSLVRQLKKGTRVCRGRDWEWGSEDHGGFGTVTSAFESGWCTVRWDYGGTEHDYRMGAHYSYDLYIL